RQKRILPAPIEPGSPPEPAESGRELFEMAEMTGVSKWLEQVKRVKGLRERMRGKGIADFIRALREEAGAAAVLDPFQRDVVAALGKIVGRNPRHFPRYNREDIWFIDRDSWVCGMIGFTDRTASRTIGVCAVFSDGSESRYIAAIDARLTDYYYAVRTALHEQLHHKFTLGGAAAYRTDPAELLLHSVLKEATVEELVVELMTEAARYDKRLKEGMIYRIDSLYNFIGAYFSRGILHKEMEKVADYPLEREFKNSACRALGGGFRKDIDEYLETGDSSKLRAWTGEAVWAALIDLTDMALPPEEAGFEDFMDYANPGYRVYLDAMTRALAAVSKGEAEGPLQQKVKASERLIRALYNRMGDVATLIGEAHAIFDEDERLRAAGIHLVEKIFMAGPTEEPAQFDVESMLDTRILETAEKQTGLRPAVPRSEGVLKLMTGEDIALEAI
ncbi:MAG: hypothetical protein HY589_02335, partial [Candidatus Omnitrophica bacterium]|nr:hypothetical protein [Candidatus Omnitrophota bacterium]